MYLFYSCWSHWLYQIQSSCSNYGTLCFSTESYAIGKMTHTSSSIKFVYFKVRFLNSFKYCGSLNNPKEIFKRTKVKRSREPLNLPNPSIRKLIIHTWSNIPSSEVQLLLAENTLTFLRISPFCPIFSMSIYLILQRESSFIWKYYAVWEDFYRFWSSLFHKIYSDHQDHLQWALVSRESEKE